MANAETSFLVGKVGGRVTVEQAYASARRAGLCLLATVKAELGDLRKVKRYREGPRHGQRHAGFQGPH